MCLPDHGCLPGQLRDLTEVEHLGAEHARDRVWSLLLDAAAEPELPALFAGTLLVVGVRRDLEGLYVRGAGVAVLHVDGLVWLVVVFGIVEIVEFVEKKRKLVEQESWSNMEGVRGRQRSYMLIGIWCLSHASMATPLPSSSQLR